MIQVEINNELVEVSKHQLFALATRGRIGPKTKIVFNGKESTAGKVKGIEFGEKTVEEPVATKTNSTISTPSTTQTPQQFQFTAEEQAEIDKFLSVYGNDINAPKYGGTLIHNAKSIAVIKYLISQGANINVKNKDEATLLHWRVVGGGDPELLSFLISAGADVNAKNKKR